MTKGNLFVAAALAAGAVCGGELNVQLLPGEYWWGGQVADGMLMPFSAKTKYSMNLCGRNDGNYNGQCNQCQGLLISSKGRYIWNDLPFEFTFEDGVLKAKGGAEFDFAQANAKTLKGAFLDVSRKHFPASGKMPDEKLFTAPQWNTWIELTYNQNQKDMEKYAESIIKNGFTPGVLMIDDTWQTAYGVWEFNPARFPDPKAMCDKFHKMGFKLMLWVCPYVSADSAEFRNELWNQGGLLKDAQRPDRPALFHWWNGYSALVDFSSPAGMAWFKGKLAALQERYGVDGFKLDAGDATRINREKFIAHDPAAATPEAQSKLFGQVGLDFPLNEYRAMWQNGGQPLAERLHDKNHDWRDMHQCVSDILVQGLEGYSFNCPDMIGGGQWTSFLPGKKIDFKMIVRSAQVHALMPMMQFSVNPWRIITKPEDQKYLDAIKRAVAIRQAHVPRIMELARESAKSGEPIARHMAYVFPEAGMEEVRDQFVLGDDLIVAPVLDASDARTVRLPAGKWTGDDGVSYVGPVEVKLENVALDRLPRFKFSK